MPGGDDESRVLSELARSCAAGDRNAERELCARLYPRVCAWSALKLRDRVAAKDLAQQTLLVLMEALRAGKVESFDRLSAFVLGTCRNTLMAWRRGERRRSALLETFGPSMFDEASIDESALDRQRVVDCFAKLPSRAQTVLALTFYAEAPGDAIASELALSEANVRVLRHRALRQLRACVTGEPDA